MITSENFSRIINEHSHLFPKVYKLWAYGNNIPALGSGFNSAQWENASKSPSTEKYVKDPRHIDNIE